MKLVFFFFLKHLYIWVYIIPLFLGQFIQPGGGEDILKNSALDEGNVQVFNPIIIDDRKV